MIYDIYIYIYIIYICNTFNEILNKARKLYHENGVYLSIAVVSTSGFSMNCVFIKRVVMTKVILNYFL